MNHILSLNSPLQSIFWSKTNTLPKQILLIVAGVMLLALSAHISIPLQPVPLTFQSATVVFVGMAYGARLGAFTLTTYLIAGLIGLPVFADTESHLVFGPTAGYLIGFLPAAALSGYLAQKGWARTIIRSFIASCLGASVIFLCGVTVLSQFVGLHQAIAFGLMPFIITEPMKLFTTSLIVPKLWKK
ncbi:biotin transporter BioY [Aquicella lusitana]|uniref:Biotin transporter n=1 Tax=Aquicella lusitana TaxID=254246 RepID=A0A370GKJ5_9COXI|nr:biotin transporter BioY [Aquicella lusitana]RDI43746.1 biotin transport system substrate-specific component [Aquicella lusitana]VVC74523.1 Biotin transporter BioY [Aquicella lusitana]